MPETIIQANWMYPISMRDQSFQSVRELLGQQHMDYYYFFDGSYDLFMPMRASASLEGEATHVFHSMRWTQEKLDSLNVLTIIQDNPVLKCQSGDPKIILQDANLLTIGEDAGRVWEHPDFWENYLEAERVEIARQLTMGLVHPDLEGFTVGVDGKMTSRGLARQPAVSKRRFEERSFADYNAAHVVRQF